MTFIALCPWSPRDVLVLCNRGIFMARSPVVGVRSCGAPRYIHRNKVMRSPWENERDRLKGENDKLERDGDYDREARTLLPEIPPRNWFHPSFPFWFFFAFFSLFPLSFGVPFSYVPAKPMGYLWKLERPKTRGSAAEPKFTMRIEFHNRATRAQWDEIALQRGSGFIISPVHVVVGFAPAEHVFPWLSRLRE